MLTEEKLSFCAQIYIYFKNISIFDSKNICKILIHINKSTNKTVISTFWITIYCIIKQITGSPWLVNYLIYMNQPNV